jgi:hypothetical protein
MWSCGHHSLPHTPSTHVWLMPNSKYLTHGIRNLVSLITKTKLGFQQGGRPTLCGVGWPRVTPGPQSLSFWRNIISEDHHHWFEVDSRSMVQMDGHTDPWTHHFHIGSPNVIKLCTQGLHKRDYRAKDGVLHLSWAVGWSKALLPDHPRKLHYLNFGHMQRSTKLIDPSYAWWGILIQGWRGCHMDS